MPRLQLNAARPKRMAVLALVALGMIVYVNCLFSEFVFDDLLYVNDSVLDARGMKWLAPDTDLPIKGRPLVGLTFVVNYALGSANPEGYHLFNMLVHLGCAVALFATVRRALAAWSGGDEEPTGAAFACAVLWMLHPMQTECVNYVSQRTESMAAFFLFVSLYCAIRCYESSHRVGWILATGIASWAGILCKETAAVGPLLIILLDLTFSARCRDTLRERWTLYAAACSCWLPLAGLLYLLPRTVTVGANEEVTAIQYALNQSILIVQYLRLVFWPDVLVIDYGRPSDVAWVTALPAVFAVFSLLALIALLYRRIPSVGYLGLASFLLLAPTSSVLPITSEVGAERRMYVPLAAISLLVVLGTREIVRRACLWFERRDPSLDRPRCTTLPTVRAVTQVMLLTTAVLGLGLRTVQRNGEYAVPTKLWEQAVQAYPNNSRAWAWLVLELARVDPARAERTSAEMAARWHDDRTVLFDVAEAYLCLHQKASVASRYYRRIVELDPSHVRSKMRLVWLLAGCAEDSVRDGNEALRIAKSLSEQHPDAPEILDVLAIAQAECGEFEAAIATAEAAIAMTEAAGGSTDSLRRRVEGYRRGQPFRFDAI